MPDLLVHWHAAGTPAAAGKLDRQRALVCAVRSPQHAARLAGLASGVSGEPLVFVGEARALAPLPGGAPVIAVPAFDLGAILEALPAALAAAAAAAPSHAPAPPSRLARRPSRRLPASA
jgi:hypothetical protein